MRAKSADRVDLIIILGVSVLEMRVALIGRREAPLEPLKVWPTWGGRAWDLASQHLREGRPAEAGSDKHRNGSGSERSASEGVWSERASGLAT